MGILKVELDYFLDDKLLWVENGKVSLKDLNKKEFPLFQDFTNWHQFQIK
jgi:hypothetical protein